MASVLDPTRQQAWFAYYATGDAIADSAHALAVDVLATMNAHGITRISVCAHSMGGRVAWRAIAELEMQVTVMRFISTIHPGAATLRPNSEPGSRRRRCRSGSTSRRKARP